MRRFAPFVVLIASFASSVFASEIRCDVTAKYACSSQGCAENTLGVWNVISFEDQQFSRCDQNGCDHYSMVATKSGAFLTIQIPNKGMLAKMSADGSEYVEVVTLGTNVLISYGSCR